MTTRPLLRFTLAATLAVCAPGYASADWPTFRGADRTGVADAENLLESWPAGGPPLVWETSGAGRGYASPAVADGRIYTLGDGLSTAPDADEYLSCFDQATGRQLWSAKTGPAWNEGQQSWQSSRSTPTIDGDRVYVITAYGLLHCFDTSGKSRWKVDLKQQFGGQKADIWGYSESPLIDGDRLICTPGGPDATMIALDKNTAKLIWKAARGGGEGNGGQVGAGHASVVPSTVGGTKVYVQTTGSGAMGVRADDGELMWTYDIDRTTAVIPTPIVRDDLVFIVAGYGRGGALLRQVPSGDKVNVQEVYELQKDLANKHGGVVLVGDYLYGDSDDKGIPYCAELMTGEIRWKSRGSGKGSAAVSAADGHLYFLYADGVMTLVKADPSKFQEVGNFEVPHSDGRPSWAHPVITDGKLLIRQGDYILCYDVSKK